MLGSFRWKRITISSLAVTAVLGVLAFVVIEMLSRVPAYYGSVESLSAEDCTSESRQFVRQSTAVLNQIENEPAWSGTFRERQVNAWLARDFVRKHADLLPNGVTHPRVSFDNGRLTLGFRTNCGPLATVISACGRVWMPETNYIAIEWERVHAGAIPIPVAIVMNSVSAAARSAGLSLEWKQHAGRPVALVRLLSSENQKAIRIDQIELREGMLYLAGRSPGAAPDRSLPGRHATSDVSLNDQAPEATIQR